MRLHGNAKLTPFQRALLCDRVREEGWTVEAAADGCWLFGTHRVSVVGPAVGG